MVSFRCRSLWLSPGQCGHNEIRRLRHGEGVLYLGGAHTLCPLLHEAVNSSSIRSPEARVDSRLHALDDISAPPWGGRLPPLTEFLGLVLIAAIDECYLKGGGLCTGLPGGQSPPLLRSVKVVFLLQTMYSLVPGSREHTAWLETCLLLAPGLSRRGSCTRPRSV